MRLATEASVREMPSTGADGMFFSTGPAATRTDLRCTATHLLSAEGLRVKDRPAVAAELPLSANLMCMLGN